MKVFVTGATGLLGNNLVRHLDAAGHSVFALARSAAKADRVLAGSSARIVVGDMQDVSGFASHLDGCEAVFHTAAYFREAFEPGSDPDLLDAINIGGTMALLDAADAADVPCFVHVGSGGTIGRKPDGAPGDEDTPPLPMQTENAYFRSKLKGDDAIAAWRTRSGIEIVEMLPGWIWGPWDAAPTAAGKLIGEFAAGKIPASIGGGTSVVDARDVAAAMTAAAEASVVRRQASSQEPTSAGTPTVHRYVVGGHFCTMHDIMSYLETVLGTPAPRLTIPFPILLAYAYACEIWGTWTGGAPVLTRQAVRTIHARFELDSSKAMRELGASFRDPLETFRDSVQWHRDHIGLD